MLSRNREVSGGYAQMTHRILRASSLEGDSWNENTLSPVRFIPRVLLEDLLWHLRTYKKAKLKFGELAIFIFLRLTQIVAYTRGWRKAQRNRIQEVEQMTRY
jgi:hypothetical protein